MIMNSDTNNPDDQDLEKLDQLLGVWHEDIEGRAKAARKRVLEANGVADTSERNPILGRISMYSYARYLPYAAIIGIALIVAFLATPQLTPRSFAQDGVVMLPDGGNLDAFDKDGNEIGPCALEHTDVHALVSGHIVRVDVEQTFGNPYDTVIEAVYTFPLSHRGAVDRMRMTIRSGDEERIVEGEIEERERARAIYETARNAGYVSSLLEQERPNIFTQSVANIEPGAEIIISISYVETLEEIDGTYKLAFPTVVGPRYIPGYPAGAIEMPPGCVARKGIVLRGPAEIVATANEDQTNQIDPALLTNGIPISPPDWFDPNKPIEAMKTFQVRYADGSREPAALFADSTGIVGGRWFFWQEPKPGAPFSPDTDQVPDASKITPMPVRPGTRAGHDISIRVEIETGGAEIVSVDAPLHEIVEVAPPTGKGSKGRKVFELASRKTIPNRDFILEWTLGNDGIGESIITHATNASNVLLLDGSEEGGTVVDGYLAVILNPPPRVEDAEIPARELIFVLDTSGSMNGFPIEKAKAVMAQAIDGMRPKDTFNLITFAGDTHILWDTPRPATQKNRDLANEFVKSRQSGGGTEMMQAIKAALTQEVADNQLMTPMELANLPADGRTVRVELPFEDYANRFIEVNSDVRIEIETSIAIPERPASMEGKSIHGELPIEVEGQWTTKNGRRVLVVDKTKFIDDGATDTQPMRIVVFMTDGYVGNENAILSEIRKNAETTRVFSFGIGNSTNRYLLDGMAEAGRGAAEYVNLNADADAIVDRFARRIQNPVLIDLAMETDGIQLLDVVPSGQYLPDLYDEKPITILARYQTPGEGTITLRGRTGSGPWSRTIHVTLPEDEQANDVVATLWAREKVDDILAPHLDKLQMGAVDIATKKEVIKLGKQYSIMTPFTSFVAVEKTRVVSDGKPMLVHIPIELPDGTDWEGFFGNPNADPVDSRLEQIALGISLPEEPAETEHALEADIAVDQIVGTAVVPPPSVNSAVVPPPSSAAPRSLGSPASSRGRAQQSTNLAFQAPAGNQNYWYGQNGRTSSSVGGAFGSGGGGGRGGVIGAGGSMPKTRGSRSSRGRRSTESSSNTRESAIEQSAMKAPQYLTAEEFKTLGRVLDRPLFRLAVRALLPEKLAQSIQLTTEEMFIDSSGTVLVSIKLDPADESQLTELKANGFKLVGINNKTGIAVGRVTPRQLAAIGLLDGVRRIVPTNLEFESSS